MSFLRLPYYVEILWKQDKNGIVGYQYPLRGRGSNGLFQTLQIWRCGLAFSRDSSHNYYHPRPLLSFVLSISQFPVYRRIPCRQVTLTCRVCQSVYTPLLLRSAGKTEDIDEYYNLPIIRLYLMMTNEHFLRSTLCDSYQSYICMKTSDRQASIFSAHITWILVSQPALLFPWCRVPEARLQPSLWLFSLAKSSCCDLTCHSPTHLYPASQPQFDLVPQLTSSLLCLSYMNSELGCRVESPV